MISVWVGMCWTCCVGGLRIGGAAAVIHIPLTGFDRLDYAALCAREDFARPVRPVLNFARLTETADYITQGVDGRGSLSR